MHATGHRLRVLGLVCLLGLGAVLAGCAASEPQPALVAKSDTGEYGYSETKLSETRSQIVYESPVLDADVSSGRRAQELEKERQRAYDFALWHAADLAKQRGFTDLVIEKEQRDADVSVEREPYYPWGGYHGYYSRYYGYPYGYYRPYGYGPYGYGPWGYGPSGYHRWAWAEVKVTLDVLFLKAPTDNSLSVEETLKQLASRYGRPTYP
jgi:hypothetical protein